MGVIHITEADAARDFAGLLNRVRGGVEVVIDHDTSAAVVLSAAPEPKLRRLSESLRLARKNGSVAKLDGDFAGDLEAIIASHPESLTNPWE